jgi:hypothetical protein
MKLAIKRLSAVLLLIAVIAAFPVNPVAAFAIAFLGAALLAGTGG